MTVKHNTLYVRDSSTRRYRRAQPQEIITTAEEVITQIFCRGTPITGAAAVKQFFVTKLATKEAEVFGVMFLNNKHELLEFEQMFTGTIDSSAVYPREIAKRALQLNAAASSVYTTIVRGTRKRPALIKQSRSRSEKR